MNFHHTETTVTSTSKLHSGWSGVTGVVSVECWVISVMLQVISMVPKNPTFDAFGRNNHHGTIISPLKVASFSMITVPSLILTVRTCQVAPSQKETIVFQPSIWRCENVSFREDTVSHLHHPSPMCRIKWWVGIIHFFAVYLAHHSWTPKESA